MSLKSFAWPVLQCCFFFYTCAAPIQLSGGSVENATHSELSERGSLSVDSGRPDALLHWNSVFQPSHVPWVDDVVFENGLFIAFGYDIMTSPDGSSWTIQNFKPPDQIKKMAYGNGRFVAVGIVYDGAGNEQGFILTSTDGFEWMTAPQPPEAFRSVSFGNGIFVAVGRSRIYTSVDAQLWTATGMEGTYSAEITYGGSQFVAVGSATATCSSDGKNWTKRTLVDPMASDFRSIIYGSGVYVTVGQEIYYSTNAVAWSKASVQLNVDHGSYQLSGVTYGQGRFVTTGYRMNGGAGIVFTSLDGIHWTESAANNPIPSTGVAFGKGRFVSADYNGTVFTSIDGEAWELNQLARRKRLFGVAATGGRFVAVGYMPEGPETYILTSFDAKTWSPQNVKLSDIMTDIAGGNGIFVAVGSYRTAYASSDGINWIESHLPQGYSRNVFWLQGRFFATVNGKLFLSENGRDWALCNTGYSDRIFDVTFGQGKFMAVGGAQNYLSSAIFVSTNGVDWVRQPQQSGNALVGVAYGNGRFVATQWLGPTLVSNDGTNWASYAFPYSSEEALFRMQFVRGRFLAVGAARKDYWLSTDGVSWQKFPPPPVPSPMNYSVVGDRLYITSDGSGAIWQSDPLSPPFQVSVMSDEESFQIQRFSSEPANVELEVSYVLSVTSKDGITQSETNIAVMQANKSTTRVYVAPRNFSSATLTLQGGESYDSASPSSAIFSLPPGEFIPRIRRSFVRLRDRIRLTVDAPRNSKLVFEESADLKVWAPAGVYTNQMDVLEVDFRVKTNSPVFYRVRKLEK